VAPATRPRKAAQLSVPPGGADLVVQKFTNAGDGPSTLSVSDGGGKKLRNTKVNLIFWGDAWNTNPPPNPSLAQVVNDVASILSGPYMTRIGQYGATRATLGDVFFTTGTNPRANFTNGQVQSFIINAIENGPLPEPDEESTDFLHCVMMPPGSNPPPNLGGEHSYASYTDLDFFDFDINDRSHVAWVANGSRAFMSSVFSHELVEAASDPEGDGIQVNPRNANSWNEIGDVCRSTGLVNGVTVQSYWSQMDQACVIPVDIPLSMQITCITKRPRNDPYHPILAVCGINLTQNIPFRLSQLSCIASIDRGNQFFVIGPDGSRADVRVYIHFPPWNQRGIRYIATVPDNTRADNLLSLPEC